MRFHTDFVFTDNPGRPSCHASTLAELADGTLLCAWYAGDYEKHPNVAIQLARRAPGALDWSAPVVIQDTPGLSEGNPVLYVAPDGVVWLFYVTMHGGTWNDCKVYYRQSRCRLLLMTYEYSWNGHPHRRTGNGEASPSNL